MTKEEYIEYWKSMSHDELMVRCGLYIDKIAELERQLAEAQQWQPVEDGRIDDPGIDDGRFVVVSDNGKTILCCLKHLSFGDFCLPDDIRLCRKVQP